MKETKRIKRVNSLLKEEISEIILNEIHHPQVKKGLVSVMRVLTSGDLRNAKVYISVFDEDKNTLDECIEALNHSKSFIHRVLRTKIRLKYIPVLHFLKDTSIEHGVKISNLLKGILKDERSDRTDNKDPENI